MTDSGQQPERVDRARVILANAYRDANAPADFVEEVSSGNINRTGLEIPLGAVRTALTETGRVGEGDGWRCYHCGETFTDDRCARLHFGRDEASEAACVIKAGAEGNLLRALRSAEEQADDAMQAVHAECTDAAKAYHAATARHSQALIAAEEAGYERGLDDGRALAAAPTPPAQEALTASEIRDHAIAVVKAEAMEMSYCEDDVAAVGLADGDDGLAVQAVERALTLSPLPPAPATPAPDVLREALEPLVARLEDLKSTCDTAMANSQGLADHKMIILANYGDLALSMTKAFRAALSREPGK